MIIQTHLYICIFINHRNKLKKTCLQKNTRKQITKKLIFFFFKFIKKIKQYNSVNHLHLHSKLMQFVFF